MAQMQYAVQSFVQTSVQIVVQKNGSDTEIGADAGAESQIAQISLPHQFCNKMIQFPYNTAKGITMQNDLQSFVQKMAEMRVRLQLIAQDAEIVQIFCADRFAEKNGRDANYLQIPCRSDLQNRCRRIGRKNGTDRLRRKICADADTFADAESRAVLFADVCAVLRADFRAENCFACVILTRL